VLPRPLARSFAAGVVRLFYALLPGLRKNRGSEFAHRLSGVERRAAQTVVRGMLRNLGWMAASLPRAPKYSKENIEQVVVLDGHENFLEGQRRGKGVL